MILRTAWLHNSNTPCVATWFDSESNENYNLSTKDRLWMLWKVLSEKRLIGIVFEKSFLEQEASQ